MAGKGARPDGTPTAERLPHTDSPVRSAQLRLLLFQLGLLLQPSLNTQARYSSSPNVARLTKSWHVSCIFVHVPKMTPATASLHALSGIASLATLFKPTQARPHQKGSSQRSKSNLVTKESLGLHTGNGSQKAHEQSFSIVLGTEIVVAFKASLVLFDLQ